MPVDAGVPPAGDPAPSPAGPLKGRRSDLFNALRASMEKAYEEGDPVVWEQESREQINRLKSSERDLLLELMKVEAEKAMEL